MKVKYRKYNVKTVKNVTCSVKENVQKNEKIDFRWFFSLNFQTRNETLMTLKSDV